MIQPMRLPMACGLAALLLAAVMAPHAVSARRPAPPAYVLVNWLRPRQVIDGFGAAFPHQATDLMNLPEPNRSRILDLFFSPSSGAGLSILRSEIGCGNDGTMGTFEPAPGTFDFTGDRGQVWLMRQAEARAPVTLFSTVWSPPAWMKTNGQCTHGGYLAPAHYADFARYLSMYVRGYRRYHGVTIGAISLSNEPNAAYRFQSSQWTGAGYHDLIARYLGPAFARDGVTATIMMPESFWNTQNDIISPTLADPASAGVVGVIAGHGYHSVPTPWSLAIAHGKRTWQTELSYFGHEDPSIADGLHWAINLHDYMTHAGASAWLWWWGLNGAGVRGDGEGLIYSMNSGASYFVSKRLFTIGNFSRFVRPGYLRLGATSEPAPGIYTSAYRDPNATRLLVVAINTAPAARRLHVAVLGTGLRSVTPYVTDATRNLAGQPAIAASPGGFDAVLAPSSVTTFVGGGLYEPDSLCFGRVMRRC